MLPPSTHAFDVIVVGGGIAGIAAAVALANAGRRVVLVEARRRLGGRAGSFVDVQRGEVLDNCQHVTLGCCTQYLELCRLLGVEEAFAWEDRQWWVEVGGRSTMLEPGLLPAPLHYAGSFLGASFLSLEDKLAIGKAFVHLALVDGAAMRSVTFGDYLRTLEQPPTTLARFWNPVVVSACNLSPQRVSAALAIKVFQDGFLVSRRAGRIGLPTVALSSLYDATGGLLAASGGEIMFGAAAERVMPTSVDLADGRRLRARQVICALPLEKAGGVVVDGEGREDDRLGPLMRELTFSPIVGVHLAFDRCVLTTPHAVLVDVMTQWLFRKSADGRRIHAVISAGDELVEQDQETILRKVVSDIRACFPGAERATLEWGRAVKERRATFAGTPGFEEARAGLPALARGRVLLAGDYTNTGWPATMEGAARSGFDAAAAALAGGR